ncbi:MAG: hypothetical protein M1118_08055 [Chloroflexi bacterium]|nr:hypothetical protein [Chloroflexota bacterium]
MRRAPLEQRVGGLPPTVRSGELGSLSQPPEDRPVDYLQQLLHGGGICRLADEAEQIVSAIQQGLCSRVVVATFSPSH